MLNYFPNTSATHGMGDQFRPFAIQMVTKMGFQFSSMLIALLTIILAAGAVASELDSGLIQGIITRPIHRYQYILGKLVGLIILACLYASVLFFSILLIGYWFDLSTITSLTFTQTMKGWLLYLLLPSALVCLTLFGSVYFKTVSNGILVIFIYILGNVGGMVEMIGQYVNSNSIIGTGIFISLVSPFQTIYSTMERVMVPGSELAGTAMAGASLSGSGEPASVWMFVYIAIYMLAFVALAINKFSNKDIT
ncbi:ABC transporter permease [Desulfuribacillus alkaliarsenatis]|uniref:ABC transporter permease n=2 Tax=Desulfuribacillus alkaliarsenatis TaxID=766136 RepID=A0A1E5G1B2_9FIRM|nr:ABC transporter permease [Desulfuribacillus alkaliarsenatis]